jgi:hypothetical protein
LAIYQFAGSSFRVNAEMVNRGIGAKLTAVTIHNSCLLWLPIGVSPFGAGQTGRASEFGLGTKAALPGRFQWAAWRSVRKPDIRSSNSSDQLNLDAAEPFQNDYSRGGLKLLASSRQSYKGRTIRGPAFGRIGK